jgi:hypothetical protein
VLRSYACVLLMLVLCEFDILTKYFEYMFIVCVCVCVCVYMWVFWLLVLYVVE